MTGAISQMQVLYDPSEDRILFRLNTTSQEQFRFWFTRRYTVLLLQVLKQHLESDPDVSLQGTPEAKEAVKSFKQEKAVQSANFSQSFKEDANDLPLGQRALLAYRLSYSVKGTILNLSLQPRQGQGITMAINQEINVSFSQLLINAANKGEWLLGHLSTNSALLSQENIVIN